MSDTLLCGKVTECEGEIVSVAVWRVEEFVPVGSYQHREMVARQTLRITEVPESNLVGRAERARTWRFILFALGLFWLAVGIAFLRRYL